MCVIAVVPTGKKLNRETFKQCWEANPHGGGFMYHNGSELVVQKPFFNVDHFWKVYSEDFLRAKGPMVLHFRIATSGGVNALNCHPFKYDNYALVHNGILPVHVPKRSKINDTQIFIEEMLEGIKLTPEVLAITGRMIGSYNKLVIMDDKGEVLYINKHRGEIVDGVWFSNLDFVPVKRKRNNEQTNLQGDPQAAPGENNFSKEFWW